MELDPLRFYADDAPNCEVHHPYGAYCQGHDAGLQGYSARLNPYPPGTRERRFWSSGHFDASCEENGVLVFHSAEDFVYALIA